MHKIKDFFKGYVLYIVGFILLGWGIASTVIAIQNGFRMQRQSGSGGEKVIATGFVPYALEVSTATPQPGQSETRDTSMPEATLAPSPTLVPVGEAPLRFVVHELGIDAPVISALVQLVEVDGKVFQQWAAPDEKAAGWQTTSAGLGVAGNTVLIGHHNVYGRVFEKLIYLVPGDEIELYGEERLYRYKVVNKLLVEERDMPVEKRLENAQWLQPSSDERLTVVTCWPETSNTHRLIIVAVPAGDEPLPTPTGSK